MTIDVPFMNGPPPNMRFARRMDELGFFHFPSRGICGGALFPKRQEPSGNDGKHAKLLPAPQYIRETIEVKNIGSKIGIRLAKEE
jgi:hypothetical protein